MHTLFIFIAFFLINFADFHSTFMNETYLLHMHMPYIWNITSVASFERPLGSKGCQHKKKTFKKGMCCASALVRSIEILCVLE